MQSEVDQNSLTLSSSTKVSYSEVLTKILQVANKHKSSMLRSSALIVLPIIISAVSLFLITILPPKNADEANTLWYVGAISLFVTFIVSLLITPLWMAAVLRIAKLEQVLWLKSYFDNEIDVDNHYFKRALRLFWPSVRVSWGLFLRYYWMFWLTVVLVAGGIFALARTGTDGMQYFAIAAGSACALPALIILYYFFSQYASVRTRYVQIVLVNTYGKPGFTYRDVFETNKRLTELDSTSGNSFGKLLAITVGTDLAVVTATSTASGVVASGASTAIDAITGNAEAANATSALVSVYGSGASILSESLAETIIYYLYYLQATQNLMAKSSQLSKVHKKQP